MILKTQLPGDVVGLRVYTDLNKEEVIQVRLKESDSVTSESDSVTSERKLKGLKFCSRLSFYFSCSISSDFQCIPCMQQLILEDFGIDINRC